MWRSIGGSFAAFASGRTPGVRVPRRRVVTVAELRSSTMFRLLRRRTVAISVLLVAVLASPAAAAAARHASFRVGAAVEDIDPPVPVYAGGFGASPPIQRTLGHLQVRAMYISNGHRAVAFAIVDSQAYFAAYQEGPNYGITSVRQQASAQMSRLGPAMSRADIIVQGTHSHSAATLEGIWGPVPLSYLKLVHDQTVAALVAAARTARPAQLQYASVEAPELDNSATAQYDSFPGWTQDGQLSVLRAVTPRSGATIATFVNVPAHPDIVCGACLKTLTADYLGAVRDALDRRLGGVTVATPATLGREESPVQATGIGEMRWFARVVAALAGAALERPHWITDSTIGAAESMAEIPGANPALLALVEANHLPDSAKQQLLSASGEYPIDRQDTPPYQSGSLIGTYLTALRIGPLAYLSMPGEPFPEVRLTIAGAVHGAAMIVALSKGQDDLGYFYPSWVTPFTEFYPSDTLTNSASAFAGDDLIRAQAQNLRAIGFDVARAFPRPVGIRPVQQLAPGLQVVGGPLTTDAGASGRAVVQLLATYSPPDLPEGTLSYGPPVGGVDAGQKTGGPVTWLFGDGSTGHSGFHEFGGTDQKPLTVVHRYRVGSYAVHASVQSADGRAASTSFTVRVYPRLRVSVRVRRAGAGLLLTPVVRGGDGQLLAVRWRLPGGTVRWGSRLAVARGVRAVTVTVTDGTGSQLTVLSNLRA